MGGRDLPPAPLPPYEPPPPFLPVDKRQEHPDYSSDLRYFLPRTVYLRRNRENESLGFNIRGGQFKGSGMFISRVVPDSESDRLGLQEGDQILAVNGIDFESIEHENAVQLLKNSMQVHMTVRFFPYGYRKSYAEQNGAQQQNDR
ncbi:hypothetical protein CAPTEDRAFT_221176 [Capitella teleta]|uniref:PDZ domain-containing protein n=1 Tax=Capitella teleta TaxID=283909 RepID=R7V2L6_CAPTE|nr:hypothetical protein CAPTEDRAFT_221176 [Capitella teleta]|eukprot:ELU12779.1 hypothetical protein CAPTEDRAFT_221176 [Capitella teleta]